MAKTKTTPRKSGSKSLTLQSFHGAPGCNLAVHKWDNHEFCAACRDCDEENQCDVCGQWTSSIWSKLRASRRLAVKAKGKHLEKWVPCRDAQMTVTAPSVCHQQPVPTVRCALLLPERMPALSFIRTMIRHCSRARRGRNSCVCPVSRRQWNWWQPPSDSSHGYLSDDASSDMGFISRGFSNPLSKLFT